MFLYHGERDAMIGCHDATITYDLFKQYNLNYEFHTERGLEHALSIAEL
jgi:hypothetical protein